MDKPPNIVKLPERNRKQGLAGMLRHLAEQADAGDIVSCGIVCTRVGDDATDPPISLYRWKPTYALIGASLFLTRALMEDGDDENAA